MIRFEPHGQRLDGLGGDRPGVVVLQCSLDVACDRRQHRARLRVERARSTKPPMKLSQQRTQIRVGHFDLRNDASGITLAPI